MKKGLLLGGAMLMTFGMVEAASATPVNFDLAGDPASSVSVFGVSSILGEANLTGALAPGLDSQIFSLNDGDTKAVDFFTLTASGLGLGSYQVAATLAFDLPDMAPASASGQGIFGTLYGFVTGGSLSWFNQPDAFLLADGNTISVTFDEGCKIVLGDTVMLRAHVTNWGGGEADIIDQDGNTNGTHAPVPEPATMFLFGTGLVSFAGLTLKGKKK